MSAALAAVVIWQIEKYGVASSYVLGVSLVVLGAVFTTVHLTVSDDFFRRHFGEPGMGPMQRACRTGWVGVLLGAALLGFHYGFHYLDHWGAQASTRRGKARIQVKEYSQAMDDF